MSDFLTEDAIFICNQGGVISCKDSGNNAVKHNGKNLLTTGATLKSQKGNCAFLTAAAQGTPQLCRCQLSAWISGFSPMKNSGGKSLLTTSAKNFCPVGGGSISVKDSGVSGKVITGNAPASMSVAVVTLNNPKKISVENPNFSEKISAKKVENLTIQQKNSSANSDIIENPNKSQEEITKNLFCPYNANSAKCQACEYPKVSVEVDNNSAKLRKNYFARIADENNRDEVDTHFLKVQPQFKFQAHHLISGNQIFKPHIEIVRLANFYGYDINNALNCIMLVSNNSDYGQQAGGKSANAYDTMSLSKIQWHVGGHSYQFSEEEIPRIKAQINFYTKKIFDSKLLNYAEVVADELTKIESALLNCVKCRDTPRQKNAFIARMNNLSGKIKKFLGAFTEKPQKSFPYYVSKEAYTFAFNLPRTAKIILVSRKDSGVLMEKFRAERFDEVLTSESGKKLIFNPKGEKIFSLDTLENKIECIEFCENIEHFIMADGVTFEEISFLAEENFTKKISGEFKSGANFLDIHETEILVWLRDLQDKYIYTAISQKIKDRKKSLEVST